MAKCVVQFSRGMSKILRDLADRKGTTPVDILRRSIALYRYLSNEVKMGKKVSFTRGGKALANIQLP